MLKGISPFRMDFEFCKLADLFVLKQRHYTLTKVEKGKKHNRLRYITLLNLLHQGLSIPVLEGQCPAGFSSGPNKTHPNKQVKVVKTDCKLQTIGLN